MAYGDFIRSIREKWQEQNPTKKREDFARLVGIRSETLSRWEGNHLSPRLKHLERMLDLIGVKLDDCLFLPDEIIKRDAFYRSLEVRMREIADARITAREEASQPRESSRAPPKRGHSSSG